MVKKQGIINRHLSEALAELGHTDVLAVVDCGYPIPDGSKVIDLSIDKGFPGFLDVLSRILQEIVCEEVVIAEEIKFKNEIVHSDLLKLIEGIPVSYTSHSELKSLARQAKVFVRTGEATPYSNILLRSGVDF